MTMPRTIQVVGLSHHTAQVEVREFNFIRWADHVYYEVCTNPDLLERMESSYPARSASALD